MILSKNSLKTINGSAIDLPVEHLFELPEKVLQFGTGVLLRGLPDYYIDKANKAGVFNGRVVVIKSTDTGTVDDFDKQDNLYTIYLKGIVNGMEVSEQIISSAISSVLSAANNWDKVLAVARQPTLAVIISNTTEVGIKLVNEDVRTKIPVSFPGKLLVVLYERYLAFNGSEDSGLVIIPTELIVDNGKKLKAILLELAQINKLEPGFIHWLENCNTFCNSLVDRIVPGRPDTAFAAAHEASNGYTDNLSIVAETYSLWAIEGGDKVKNVLSFAQVNPGVVITDDIELFRELKLRLLNGTHTLCCAYAYILGFKTVNEALDDTRFTEFITSLMFEEIKPAIPYPVDHIVAADFAAKVLDRFRNPYIRHGWLSISVQYSTKIKMRVIPLLINYFKLYNAVPQCMALGFAAFIRFMRIKPAGDEAYIGIVNKGEYKVTDSHAAYFAKVWENPDHKAVIEIILKNKDLWEIDLNALPGFTAAVIAHFDNINKE